MKNNLNILNDREKKYLFVQQYVKDYQVITLKANIPGCYKQTTEAYFLVNHFNQIMLQNNYINSFFLDGADGPMYIYLQSKGKELKEKMIDIENLPLGRFIDIDVFNSNISINRSKFRKCYICEQPAIVCSRNKTHSIEELNKYMSNTILKYLTEEVKRICNESILAELNLHPKFGLVTPFTNGSHQDMDYDLMLKAKDSILNYFVEMFKVGYQEEKLDNIFKQIRDIGKEAEKSMYYATNNINAYKGLIFVLGLVIASIGYKLNHRNKEIDIFKTIKQMTKDITQELNQGDETFGKIAYQKYQITGARGEAELGLPHVQFVINNLDNDNLYQILFYLIQNCDDTVLLKRCDSYEKYLKIKEKFDYKNINNELINELNEICISEKLSFGGSADLLIVCIFIKKFTNLDDILK